jgi:hypothetical protein
MGEQWAGASAYTGLVGRENFKRRQSMTQVFE